MFGLFLNFLVMPIKSTTDIEKDSCQYSEQFQKYYKKIELGNNVMTGVSMVILPVLFAVCLAWFYAGQENWYGFIYLNCVPYTSSFCLDYGLELESRNLY